MQYLKIYLDGNMWCVLYGNDLQVGICGFGATVLLALEDFGRSWMKASNKEIKEASANLESLER